MTTGHWAKWVPMVMAAAILPLCSSPSEARTLTRVSVNSAGTEGNQDSSTPELGAVSVSSGSACVAFMSQATNLVSNDTNGVTDIFVHCSDTGVTERVSVGVGGIEANAQSSTASISSDGRYVAFLSAATNLVAGDSNNANDVFRYDRMTGTTQRVSVDSNGNQSIGGSLFCKISGNGRFVVFTSGADDLVPGDTNGFADVLVKDMVTGAVEIASVDSAGVQGNSTSHYPTVSEDGRYVVFRSFASNLVPGDTNGFPDAFLRDRQASTTERIDVSTGGGEADASVPLGFSSGVSADGRYVAFESGATNLVAGDTNFSQDIFLRDRQLGTTVRISVDGGGAQANSNSRAPSMSSDGGYVVFEAAASNLVSGDTNGVPDIFRVEPVTGIIERVSVADAGTQANGTSDRYPAISGDGCNIAFNSVANNLVPNDTNGKKDAFLSVCEEAVCTDGSPCNDGDACTQTDLCKNGTCVGSNPVICTPNDQCHDATCDHATGACVNTAKPDGTACNDGNPCTTDVCTNGICVGSAIQHTITGDVTCDNEFAIYTAATENPGMAVTYRGFTGCHPAATSVTINTIDRYLYISTWSDDRVAQGLMHDLSVSGLPVFSGDPHWTVTYTDSNYTSCLGTPPVGMAATMNVTIPAPPGGWIAPAIGCANPPSGQDCYGVWGHYSTIDPTARRTWYNSGNQSSTNAPFEPGFNHREFLIFRLDLCTACGPDGTPCNDGNACTTNDTCNSGACIGTPATGTSCSDGNACTQSDTCQNGTCVGSNPVICTPSDQCHDAPCDPETGSCTNVPKPDGTACNDGNACTMNDACSHGACGGTAATHLILPNINSMTWTAQIAASNFDVAARRFTGIQFNGDFTAFQNPLGGVCPEGCNLASMAYNIGCKGNPLVGQLDMWIVRIHTPAQCNSWNEGGNQVDTRDGEVPACP